MVAGRGQRPQNGLFPPKGELLQGGDLAWTDAGACMGELAQGGGATPYPSHRRLVVNR